MEAGMDAKTLAAAAGITGITLYAWLQRNHVPGLSSGTQGRKRDYSIEDAVNIATLAELTRQGLSMPIASDIVARRGTWKRFLVHRGHRFMNIDTGDLSERERGRRLEALEPFYGGFNDYADLPKIMATHQDTDFAPAAFVVVDVEQIRIAMMRVERDYRRRLQRESDAADHRGPAAAGQLQLSGVS
jgi:hypothetical protein